MSYRSIAVQKTLGGDNGPVVGFVDYFAGDNSLWNIHGLQLRSNIFHRNYFELRNFRRVGAFLPVHPACTSGELFNYVPVNYDVLKSRSYASFRRKLYQGSASLGVTLGSYKQSREMIVGRYRQLNRRAGEILASVATTKVTAKKAASIHLEVVFGWVPLLQDIHSAATTVINEPEVHKWIRSTAREVQTTNRLDNWRNPWLKVNITNTVYAYHSRGALVTVSNPNQWLAERAGLLNPASVAWDLVPWSFVVNMFVNTGQLVNSITDFCGLTLDNGYQVQRAHGTSYWEVPYADSYNKGGSMLCYGRTKTTTLGSAVSRPPLIFKVPNANWELAAIAASLFAQKFGKIASLVKPTHRL